MAPPTDSSDGDLTADQQASDLAVDIERVADEVKAQLQPGDQIGDLVVVSRRQLIAFATGAAGVGALAQFGISEADAQAAAGQVGTSSEPVDAELYSVAFPGTDPFEVEIDDSAQEVRFNRNP
jgi:hypothetical protein